VRGPRILSHTRLEVKGHEVVHDPAQELLTHHIGRALPHGGVLAAREGLEEADRATEAVLVDARDANSSTTTVTTAEPSIRTAPSEWFEFANLQPFVEYLQGRCQGGCTNIAQLQRELRAQGYQGSYSLLMQALRPWRGLRPPPEPGRGR